MVNREMVAHEKVTNALSPVVVATDTTTNGIIIDTKGFDALMFAFMTGVLTDGNYTVLIQDGDVSNLSDAAAVTDANLVYYDSTGALVTTGQEAAASFTADTDDAKTSKIGYIGGKRYVRFNVVSDTTTTGALLAALAILGKADVSAVPSNQ